MFKIIEITRGEKPEGNCLLFGHTIESHFYIEGYSDGYYDRIDKFPDQIDKILKEIRNIMERKNFQRAKNLPLNKIFLKKEDWNY